MLAVGPVPYLYYLHQMRLLDMALMAFIAISLAFPVFIWMRPLAGHAETGIRRTALWRGHLTERIHFDSGSALNVWGWHLTRWPITSTP